MEYSFSSQQNKLKINKIFSQRRVAVTTMWVAVRADRKRQPSVQWDCLWLFLLESIAQEVLFPKNSLASLLGLAYHLVILGATSRRILREWEIGKITFPEWCEKFFYICFLLFSLLSSHHQQNCLGPFAFS